MTIMPRLALAVALALAAALPLRAQEEEGPLRIEITDGVVEPMPIAIAPFHGDAEMAARLREVVEADLTGTSLFRAIDAKAFIAAPESFTAPVAYEDWRAINAQALITAEVTVGEAAAPASPAEGAPAAEGGQITVKFRLFDVIAGEPLGEGMQFVTAEEDWRRAAHKLADQVYARLTGEDPYFDSRVAFIQETGPKDARLKRLGVMDYDGQGIDWLTDDAALVLSPRFSPDGTSILYTSFETGFPQIRLMDVATVSSRAVTDDPGSMAFAPRFSPDGRWIVYSRESSGNSDIWLMDAATAAARPLVEGPGIDTSPDFSPDGSQIVFESDRSGDQQLYTMPLTGGEPVRISFGEGRYSTPVWSPRGDVIAFTRQMGETFHIGTMRVDGSEEKTLTGSFLDEGPSWAPNGRVVMFTRVTPGGDGEPRLHSVDITGRNMRPLDLDFAASDPSWGPLLP